MILVEQEKCPKIAQKVSKIDKKGEFSSKTANIDSKTELFIHFTIKFNSKDYSMSFFSGIFNSKNYSITFFPGKFDSKIDTKFKSGFIQFFIHSIRKPRYRRPLLLSDRIFLLELCSLFFSFFVCGGSSSYFPFSMTVN